MQLDQDSVPATFEEAVRSIVNSLDEADKLAIQKTHSTDVHHGTGTFLRNNWSLWDQNTPLSKDFQKRYGLWGHGDDVSGLLLHCVWQEVRGKAWNDQAVASKFKAHWIAARP